MSPIEHIPLSVCPNRFVIWHQRSPYLILGLSLVFRRKRHFLAWKLW